jgi:hypothetical protein
MTFTMYDSTDVAHLPDGADAYAGYTSGLFPTWDALKARFTGKAHLVSIAIDATHHALCLDVENGDAIPSQVPAWVQAEHGRNVHRPIVYASASAIVEVLARLSAAGIKRDQVRLWSAHYGIGKHICGPQVKDCGFPVADATQWTNAAAGAGGGKVDESLCAADFFTQPPPQQLQEAYVVPVDPPGVPYKVTRQTGSKAWT